MKEDWSRAKRKPASNVDIMGTSGDKKEDARRASKVARAIAKIGEEYEKLSDEQKEALEILDKLEGFLKQ